jgi:hypothetical protein
MYEPAFDEDFFEHEEEIRQGMYRIVLTHVTPGPRLREESLASLPEDCQTLKSFWEAEMSLGASATWIAYGPDKRTAAVRACETAFGKEED